MIKILFVCHGKHSTAQAMQSYAMKCKDFFAFRTTTVLLLKKSPKVLNMT